MNLQTEKYYWKKGYKTIVGLDEAGRGPLAGPVAAAAVIILLPKKFSLLKNAIFKKILLQARDSKKLSSKQREEIFRLIKKCPLIQFSHALASEKVIDKINIEKATFLAMKKCLKKINLKPDIILIDGNRILDKNLKTCPERSRRIPQRAIVKGDNKIFSIALASVVAKVTRDRIMKRYHKKYPGYGFDRHKGYPTKYHFKMLKKIGPCQIHRKSYKPIRKIIKNLKHE